MISATIYGRLGADPEVTTTQGGTSVLKLRVACDHGYGDKKSTTWVRAACFGKMADGLAGKLAKGNRVVVSGELYSQEWTAKDGAAKVGLELDARDVRIIDYADSGAGQQQRSSQQQRSAPQRGAPPPAQPQRFVHPDGTASVVVNGEWVHESKLPRAQLQQPPPPPPPPAGAPGDDIPF